MTVRVDVNVFDGKEEKAKKTNCVPLKEFSINKTLSDIRKALIDNGGLDASSATGAQVNDSTSFADYLEILSENVEKDEEKPENSTKVTVHNVYIKAKDKKRTDRKAEAKELIKQELNLKLSDKPELLQTSLEQLASSFNRGDWVAEGNETSV
ncbi:hypothetical protein N7532_006249 [Penicillium argentinense]|uniref:Uncharacterized protein n=1 Tax=Penicillium argentinense TaxID=1131581 RepID=A0A9W9FFF4_9EURO|nr:uncharacterized protein N7532_006249 [Penicillium argentinense]KAJ5099248.1 hypothetical protein N7532_006249 [Penicillium argentinense]